MQFGGLRANLVLSLLLAGALLAGCGRSHRKPPPAAQKAIPPTFRANLTNVHPSQVDEKGRKLWEASAQSLQASQTKQFVELVKVRVTLFQEGRPEIILEAPKMTANYADRKVYLTGGVRAESKRQQVRFTTANLTWDARKNEFTGLGGVKMTRGLAAMTGGRIIGDTRLGKVKILDNPRLVVKGQ